MTGTRPTHPGNVIVALVLPLTALLAGCAGPSTAPASTPAAESAPPAATPTEDPADPLEAVVSIVVRPDGLELRDAGDAVVAEVDYMGAADEAVATLSTVFAAEPVSEPIEADLHSPGGVRHSWDGMSLVEIHYDEERRESEDLDNLLWPRVMALVVAPEVGDVVLTSVVGAVGDRADDLTAPIDPELWTCSGWAVETVDVVRASGTTVAVGVSVTFSGAAGMRDTPPTAEETVTLLRAPADVAAGCV